MRKQIDDDGPIMRIAIIIILVVIVAVQAYAYSIQGTELEETLKSSHSLQEEIKVQEAIIDVLKLEIDRREEPALNPETLEVEPGPEIVAYVTGYNSVPEQTWGDPCQSATGDHICGRDDVVACPKTIDLGAMVEIDGKVYECLDRTAPKFDNRFDIFCDKDFQCPYSVTGWKEVEVVG